MVIDVGIHYKGWTRDEAIEYLSLYTDLKPLEINIEVDRCIANPGQGLSGKIGEIAIMNLRKQTEKTLSDDFNIKDFHYQILKNGSIPLPVLEDEIQNYLEKNRRYLIR